MAKEQYGLLGRNISYSFSANYFNQKFIREGIEATYCNFDFDTVLQFIEFLTSQTNIKGFNVTIPFKEEIIPYIDVMDKSASEIGAVNCVRINSNMKLLGFNTDYLGFKHSLQPLLTTHHKKALILGTGGASKAIKFALQSLNIETTIVSRVKSYEQLSYEELTSEIMKDHTIIVNCTPLGTHPNINELPPIPYENIEAGTIAYDLIYNPSETLFLKRCKERNAIIKNGYEMLERQALAGWDIWKSKTNPTQIPDNKL